MLRILLVLVSLFFANVAWAGGCNSSRIELSGDWGQAAFNIEIADTAELRGRGLMHRESMPRQRGMLFIFETPRPTVFWMKNTLIPLDMIFAGEDGVVSHIHHNAIPHDETHIPGGEEVMYVLEINGGLAQLYGITVGTQMRHPRIGADSSVADCPSE